MFDFIGDVHGEEFLLLRLLNQLGYRRSHGVMTHPERQAVFVGDLIDRGPRVRETLHLVRDMVERESAIALMGNHELNALQFHARHPITGLPLRQHTERHIRQHSATLRAFNNLEHEWSDWLLWLAELPFSFNHGSVRAIHAYWDNDALTRIKSFSSPLDIFSLAQIADTHTLEHQNTRLILAGPSVTNSTSNPNNKTEKIYWWNCIFEENSHFCTTKHQYRSEAPPLFIGHYRLKLPETLEPLAANLVCLDYNAGDGGPLVGYRWNSGEPLTKDNFVIAKN